MFKALIAKSLIVIGGSVVLGLALASASPEPDVTVSQWPPSSGCLSYDCCGPDTGCILAGSNWVFKFVASVPRHDPQSQTPKYPFGCRVAMFEGANYYNTEYDGGKRPPADE